MIRLNENLKTPKVFNLKIRIAHESDVMVKVVLNYSPNLRLAVLIEVLLVKSMYTFFIGNSIFHLNLELLTKFWKMRLKVA